MKPIVLHAVDAFLTRSETFVYTVVGAHRQFDAAVLCHTRENAGEFPFPRVYVEPRPRSRRTAAWWMAEAMERTTGRSPWRRRIEALLADLAPAVVHAHFGPIGCEMIAVTRASGVPLVTSLYGVDAAVLPYLPHWRDQYRRLFRDGDLFLAEAPEMRKKIIAAGAPPDRTILQPIALDLGKYPRWAPAGPPTVLFVGRFVDKKGLPDAIDAFARARSRVSAARLTIVGGGPGEAPARDQVRSLGLSGTVTFAGMQPHADVIARLRSAAVLIHPSVTAGDGDSEGGAPTILLEAQAIGTPIVTTRHADIPNVVPEGSGTHLCAEHDVDALADGLVAALTRPEASSPAYVTAHHDVRRAIVGLEASYRSVISRPMAARA